MRDKWILTGIAVVCMQAIANAQQQPPEVRRLDDDLGSSSARRGLGNVTSQTEPPIRPLPTPARNASEVTSLRQQLAAAQAEINDLTNSAEKADKVVEEMVLRMTGTDPQVVARFSIWASRKTAERLTLRIEFLKTLTPAN